MSDSLNVNKRLQTLSVLPFEHSAIQTTRRRKAPVEKYVYGPSSDRMERAMQNRMKTLKKTVDKLIGSDISLWLQHLDA